MDRPRLVRNGKRISIAYDLVVEGQLIESIGAQRPMNYVHGQKQILSRLEKELKGLNVGDRKEIQLSCQDGYGPVKSDRIIEIPKTSVPKKSHYIGQRIKLKKSKDMATIRAIKQGTLVLDLNHPFAGKKLNYSVLIVGIQDNGTKSVKRGGK